MVFCPKCIYATIYFQYLFFASWMFSTTLFLPPVTMQQRTFHNISQPNTKKTCKKKEKLTVCMNDTRLLLLKTVPSILAATREKLV